jgi:hypothetical protein
MTFTSPPATHSAIFRGDRRGFVEYREYVDFIKEAMGQQSQNITFVQLSQGQMKKNKKSVVLRHDVDHDLDMAVNMAKIEGAAGLKSTYFLLPDHVSNKTGRIYFDYTEKFLTKCYQIRDAGQDIALHNNFLTTHIKTGQPLRAIIDKPLNFLRSNGIEILGTACHGDPLCYTKNYYNYEVWTEFDPEATEQRSRGEYPSVPFSEFGFIYESYFSEYDYYVSDSGGSFRGADFTGTSKKLFERAIKHPDINIGLEAINKFKLSTNNSHIIQILTHPCWWGLYKK